MSDIKELKEQLFLTKKNGRLVEDDLVLAKADEYCEGYKAFWMPQKPSVRLLLKL